MPIDWNRISAAAGHCERNFEKLDVIPHYEGYTFPRLYSSRLDRGGKSAGTLVGLVLATDSGSTGDGRLLRVVHCTHAIEVCQVRACSELMVQLRSAANRTKVT